MSTTRLEILDRSVEKAHIWINDLAEDQRHISEGEGLSVLRVLPQPLRELLDTR